MRYGRQDCWPRNKKMKLKDILKKLKDKIEEEN